MSEAVTELNVIEAIRSTLDYEMERDEKVMVLGLDVGALGGVFRATRGLVDKYGRDRVFDTPLAEASIIGASLGLAVAGMRPVAEIQFLGFTHEAMHQLGYQLGRYRFRSRGRFGVPVTVRAPFGGGVKTPEFHPDAIEAQFVQTPGLKIVCPSTPLDAAGMLRTAIRSDDPVLYLEPQRLYRLGREAIPAGDWMVPFGKVRIVREGPACTLVAWSASVELCSRACDVLAAEGIECTLVDLRSLVPLDVDGLVTAVVKTGRCVIVHEAPVSGGFGAEVAATLAEEAFYDLDAPIARVGAWDTPYPPGPLEGWYLPTVERVVKAIRKTVAA
jgi:pyruvate dehydrogenase E1 component beta subunit